MKVCKVTIKHTSVGFIFFYLQENLLKFGSGLGEWRKGEHQQNSFE